MLKLETRMRIGGIIDMSTVDWYSKISLVVFWAGCNIRCPYCHNSTLIPLDSGKEVSLDFLDKRLKEGMMPVPSLDAVVFTGGEPLLQANAVIEAAKLVKEYDLKLMLDTNGTIIDAMEKVLISGLIDRVALDVKSPLNFNAFASFSNVPSMAKKHVNSIKNSLDLCNTLDIPIEARTTVAPDLSDKDEYIRDIAREIKDKIDVYYLQQFDNQGDVLDPSLKKKDPPSKIHLINLAKVAINEGVSPVYIKTRFDGLERIV